MLLGIAASFIKIPAAHYLMGGIKTDLNGLSSLKGLYCCGEAACTGAHGANRLASNSILEALVFAKRICDHLKDNDNKIIKAADNKELKKADLAAAELAELKSELKEMMAGLAGIRRKNQIFLN